MKTLPVFDLARRSRRVSLGNVALQLRPSRERLGTRLPIATCSMRFFFLACVTFCFQFKSDWFPKFLCELWVFVCLLFVCLTGDNSNLFRINSMKQRTKIKAVSTRTKQFTANVVDSFWCGHLAWYQPFSFHLLNWKPFY